VNRLKTHLSPATVISCIALFIALSGAAFAAKATIGKKAVKTRNLANGAVTTLKLRGSAVTTLKLANAAVSGPKIAPGAVGSSHLASGAVRSTALGGGVVTTGKLKDGAVATDKLANGAVTNSKLGADALTSGKIQDGAVTGAKLAPGFLSQLVKNVTYVPILGESDATSPKVVSAECPAGKQVTGGGARIVFGTAESATVTESVPALRTHPFDGVTRTSWSAEARTTDPGTWALEVVAICAEF
jgi:hypothetical protein